MQVQSPWQSPTHPIFMLVSLFCNVNLLCAEGMQVCLQVPVCNIHVHDLQVCCFLNCICIYNVYNVC
jgi:hypothetical protein